MLVKKIKNINLLFLLKTGIGSAAAIILAQELGFAYSPSAGIITLLTIQNTKKETIQIAFRRFLAFLLAVTITYLIFHSFGFSSIAFGGIVFLFTALCILLGLKDGISMNAVLMTHFLIERRMNLGLIVNEVGLLLIGMGIGIVLNLIMPKYREKIKKEQIMLEEEFKKTLRGMSVCLRKKDSDMNFTELDNLLESLMKKAYEDAGNTLLSNTKYLISYLEMRKLQAGVLKDIIEHNRDLPVILRHSLPIAGFMEHIADNFHELNNVEGLLSELKELKEYYRKEELPKTRDEFEYRAVLYQILKDLEYFLILKRNFIEELEKKNMRSYWS
jgi:uncharacterized membrane protein YgaE (UPF0421/DUF939 family)